MRAEESAVIGTLAGRWSTSEINHYVLFPSAEVESYESESLCSLRHVNVVWTTLRTRCAPTFEVLAGIRPSRLLRRLFRVCIELRSS